MSKKNLKMNLTASSGVEKNEVRRSAKMAVASRDAWIALRGSIWAEGAPVRAQGQFDLR
jgi:hypothetical protein